MNENNQKPYNLDANIEAMLCYLPFVGLLTSLAIFIMERENKFVKFHAIQGLLFAVFFTVVNIGLATTLILAILLPIVNLAAFLVWLLMMVKAYNNQEYMLPVIGKMAKDQVSK